VSDPALGFALTRQNAHVQVIRKDDGGVSLVDLRTLAALDFDAAELGQLRELLDRAAMPGQQPPAPKVCYACCACCEHNGETDPDLDDERHPNPCPHGCRPVTTGTVPGAS
jgi:hypothetical protein